MHIGYLISTFPALSETFVVNDIRGLEALGHQVTAIALCGADPNTAGNPNYQIKGKIVRVKGIGTNPLWRKWQKVSARQRLRKKYGAAFADRYDHRPEGVPEELWADRLTWDAAVEQIDREACDFLYVHFAMRQLLLGYHASRLLNVPLGVTLQAHDIFINPQKHLFPWTLGQCAFAVTVSHYNREEILRLAPGVADKLHVLASGIDVDFFRPRYHPPRDAKGRFRFAATGRLVEMKGFHVLLEAAGLIARRRRDFIVRVVGEGAMRPALEGRVAELGVGEQFQLLGRRDASFLREWLPEQDCFVMPCVIARDGNRDGMPLALREGMACGLPALSTQLLGLHETVSPGTGYLSAAGDPAALAADMERLMDLPAAAYEAMARAARAKAEAEFSLTHEVTMIQGWMRDELRRREAHAAKARSG